MIRNNEAIKVIIATECAQEASTGSKMKGIADSIINESSKLKLNLCRFKSLQERSTAKHSNETIPRRKAIGVQKWIKYYEYEANKIGDVNSGEFK